MKYRNTGDLLDSTTRYYIPDHFNLRLMEVYIKHNEMSKIKIFYLKRDKNILTISRRVLAFLSEF